MTDEAVATWIETREAGWLPFQEYFVHSQCQPSVTKFRFEGVENALPAPGVIEAIRAADWVIFCPSNPWVSIGPILAIKAVMEVLEGKRIAAVSPIVGGKAIKGPAAKMYLELGIEPSVLAVARQYQPLLTGFVMDQVDQGEADIVSQMGMEVLVTNTIMKTVADRQKLAEEVVRSCRKWMGGNGFL